MKQKKRIVGLSIAVLLIATFLLAGGTTLINNVVSRLTGNDSGEGTAVADPTDGVTCVVGDGNHDESFDVKDLVRLERYFGNVEPGRNLETDDCTLDADWNVNGGLDTDAKATIYDYTKVYEGDAEICLQMLVEDPASLQVKAKEEVYVRKFKEVDNSEFAYYTLNKALKQGWVLTFKVEQKNDSASKVAVYYPGCEEWIELGTQNLNDDKKVFTFAASEYIDMRTLQIRVQNGATTETVPLSQFRVYDIQVIKHEYVADMKIVYNEEDANAYLYNQVPEIPIVYGTQDTLDMTRFKVQTAVEGLNYDWTLSYNGELVGFDMTKDAAKTYKFNKPGIYTLTAKVKNNTNTTVDDIINKEGKNHSGEVSTTITVLDDPTVYINFDGKTVKNVVNNNEGYPTAGAYKINATNDGFVESVAAQYAKGIGGISTEGLELRHDLTYDNPETTEDEREKNGAYAVIPGYKFGTEDFTISTWFRVQTTQDNNNMVSDATNTYLFGIEDPNATTGFSVCLNPNKILLNVNGPRERADISYVAKEWNQVALRRVDKNIELYFNGELVYTYTSSAKIDFGEKDLAFGGYYGFLNPQGEINNYHQNLMVYDDIQVYAGDLADDVAQVVLTPCGVKPDVEVKYNNGEIVNTGTKQQNVSVAAYELDSNLAFAPYTSTVNYTAGVHGDTNGAIVTNHANGPYTVIKGHSLGSKDFTISTWFNISDVSKRSGGTYTYLFGTAKPDDTTKGFSAFIKDGKLQFRADKETTQISDLSFTGNTWYHLTVRRFGDDLKIYLNGTQLTSTFKAIDYDTLDIAFGAYAGMDTSSYVDNKTYFDEIKVYGTAITEEEIASLYNAAIHKPSVYVNFDGKTVKNDGKLTDIEIRSCQILDDERKQVTQNATMFGALQYEQIVSNFVGDFEKEHADYNAFLGTWRYGPYTVVRDYVFGKNNFTVSARFYGDTLGLSNSAALYLFGTDHPDAEEGFSVNIKRSAYGTQQIRVRLLGQEHFINTGLGYQHPEFQAAQWNHIVLTREGASMKVYLNDILLQTYDIDENHDYGTADLAFGGYYGFAHEYNTQNIRFDDIKVYEGALASGVSESVSKTNLIEPDVEITYENGTIENSGIDRRPTVGAVGLDQEKHPNDFVDYTGTVNYVTGIDGDAKGAITTEHYMGPYTLVDGYDMGTNNFTISTWFRMPDLESGDDKLAYLFGIAHPDNTENGFSVGIKNPPNAIQQIRIQLGNLPRWWIDLTGANQLHDNTWYHLALVRDGKDMIVYLDGVELSRKSLSENVDYGKVKLAFGGYPGAPDVYRQKDTYFDDVRVYGQALRKEYVVNVANIGKYKSTWLEQARDGETTLFIGDELFAKDNWSTLNTAYEGKDVVFAGIAGSKTTDWGVLIDRYLAHTRPRNLVVHLGSNDIEGGANAATVAQNLQSFFTQVHEMTNGNYKATKMYYFGIESNDTHADVIAEVNRLMQAWCQDASRSGWITYVAPVTSADGVKTALAGTSIKIQTLPTGKIPKVEVTYSGGVITNIGSDRTVTAGAYNITSGKFESTENKDVNYTTGVDGDASGAIITNHKTGPYTVVKGYNFGTNDFTISTRFKLDANATLYNDGGTYLFGIADPGANDGFAVCIKRYKNDETGATAQQFRVKLPGQQEQMIDLSTSTGGDKVLADTWYRLTLVREGASIKIYLNNTELELKNSTISLDEDFGTRDLAFGAYPGGTTTYHSTIMYYDDIKVYDKAYEVEELFEYGEIYSGFANEGTYPFVLFNENGECFNNRGCKTFADALHAAKQEMLNNVWDPESKTYGDNPRKVYILLRRDYETSSVNGQWEKDSTYGNWAQARGEIVIDLGGHTIKQKTSSSILRGVVSKRDGTVFPSTYTIINGKFKVTSEPLFTMQTWENKGEGTLAEKLFTFNFKNVEIGFDENATANNLLFSYYDWSPNEGALEPTVPAPFFMNFEDCVFDMKTNAPENKALTLFNIATTTNKWIKNTVTVESGEIITNTLGEGEYPTHLIVDTDITIAQDNTNVYDSSVVFVKDDKGEYTKLTLYSNTFSCENIYNKDGIELEFEAVGVDTTNSIFKHKLVEKAVVKEQ